MASFTALQGGRWSEVLDELRSRVRGCASLEQAAQEIARGLHAKFASVAPLVRVYALVRHEEAPADVRTFVEALAGEAGDRARVSAATPVLALLGTHGEKEPWCDRRTSQSHKGIPLLSGAFVDAIPMIARLLRELGIDLSWLDEAPEVVTGRLVGGFNGVFFVEDATTARDGKGRPIIPAAEFVAEQGIKSVFGTGGFYPDGTLVVCIVFTREMLAREMVERAGSLVSMLKSETFDVVRARKIFG